LLKAA